MQNNQEETPAQESKHTNESVKPEGKLCSICQTFFGQAATNYYCSQCFKQLQPENEQKQQQQKQVEQETINEEKPTQPLVDPSRCKSCNHKLGINGFLCKCSHYYCKKHRLPEEHDCKFDHAAQARKLLIENNPLIEGAKIDKI